MIPVVCDGADITQYTTWYKAYAHQYSPMLYNLDQFNVQVLEVLFVQMS